MFLLELLTALVGLRLAYVEIVENKFRNYATSVFIACFVPLFCIYPMIGRILIGGATSVRPGDGTIFDQPAVYFIYHLYCWSILLVLFLTSRSIVNRPIDGWQQKYLMTSAENIFLAFCVALGGYLYVSSTGLSFSELIRASRFEWFNNDDYSSIQFVISTYLIALSPLAIHLALHNRSKFWLLFYISLLVLIGLASKDRKWLIYILSASIAYVYLKNKFSITFQTKWVVVILFLFIALSIYQVFRDVLFNFMLSGSGDLFYESKEMAIKLMTRGDLPYFYNASMTAIHMNLNEGFSIPFGIISRQILFFVPADLSFGLKIEDISAIFSDALDAGSALRRGNMPPGFFGLFALSFGWFGGCLLCAMFPILLRKIDKNIQKNNGVITLVIHSHLFSSIILLLRGDDSSATYFIIFSIFVFLIARPAAMLRRGTV